MNKLWTPEFLSMGGCNFLVFMSQYIMIAALPIFIMDDLQGGELEAGMAMTFFQIGTVVCRPLAGRLIDSVNKRSLLFMTTLCFGLVMLGFNFFQTLTGIYSLRLLHGVIFALATTAAAAMAAMVLPVARKGEGIGYFALTTNLAMVVGPLLGLVIIGSWGAEAFFLFMVILAVFTFWVANHRRLPDHVILPVKKTRQGISIHDFIERKSVVMSSIGGLVFFAYGGVLTFIPLYAKSLGLQQETSMFFAVFAAVIVLTRPVVGRIFDAKGPDYTIYPGFLCFALGMLLFGQISTMTGLLLSAAVLGCGFGALSPAFQTLAIQSAPLSRSGVATATYFWSLDISVGLAAGLLGLVAAGYGYTFMYSVICTGVIAVAAGCYFAWNKYQQKVGNCPIAGASK